MSLFPEIGTAIKRAEARVDAFPTALFHGFNAVRPRKSYEKSHVYPISIQDAFKPVEDGEDVFRWEQVRDTKAPLRLYAHIPWCEVKCSFCRYIIDRRDPTADLVAPYFAAMSRIPRPSTPH